MREIVLDTETTGLKPHEGDRIVEIGCVELINHVPTGRTLHLYINPERDMPEAAFRVHGLSDAFLADKPLFADVAEEILSFLGDSPLVIHNAAFDMGFLNAELTRAGRSPLAMDRAVDTLRLAQRRFPGAPASLDALCRRFDIDASAREKHGALLDSELLARVYLELCGGRQPGLALAGEGAETPGGEVDAAQAAGADAAAALAAEAAARSVRPPRPHAPTPAECLAHAAFVARLTNPLWLRPPQEECGGRPASSPS